LRGDAEYDEDDDIIDAEEGVDANAEDLEDDEDDALEAIAYLGALRRRSC